MIGFRSDFNFKAFTCVAINAHHPVAFAWSTGMTVVLYLNFAWFREQLCLIVCPYGRLQSALTDEDTMVIGYDVGRGEPRGKLKKKQTEEDRAASKMQAPPI